MELGGPVRSELALEHARAGSNHDVMASHGRHPKAGLGIIVLGDAQDAAKYLHHVEVVFLEALSPDHHIVLWMAVSKIPLHAERRVASLPLPSLRAGGDGAAELASLRCRHEGRRVYCGR